MAQGWKKAFERLFWKNRPSTDTPLNATDMNHIESGIDALDDRIVQLDTLKADSSVLPYLVSSVSLDLDTGFLTVVRYGGQVSHYNTNLNKIAVNFEYDYENQRLELTLPDGNKQYVDMSALITQYEFDDSDTIIFNALPDGHIKARIADGSIEDRHLKTDYLVEIKTEVAKATNMANSATTSSNSAYNNAKLSQSYAIGGASVRDGEDTDNSKYYSEQSSKSATASANSASAASTKASEAATSASSASASATKAATSESNASKSASSAATSASTASTKASEAATSALSASSSASSASTSETNASNSAESASASASTAMQKANEASSSSKLAESSASTASSSASSANTSAANALSYADSANKSANNAAESEKNAKASENASATSEKNAKTSETNAGNSASTATSKAAAASTSASNAATSEANAKKYYEQAKSISDSFSGALRPMGTVTFANLPAVNSASAGDMYNISDEFVTTSSFVEGAGITEPAGSNVYKTESGKWDVLAGSPVTGIKGENETNFRRGNVNITKENIGLDNVDNTADAEKSVKHSASSDASDIATSLLDYGDTNPHTIKVGYRGSSLNVNEIDFIAGYTGGASNTKIKDINKTNMQTWLGLGTLAYSSETSMPASDVYDWAKQPTKPTYTASEVGALRSYDIQYDIPANSEGWHKIAKITGSSFAQSQYFDFDLYASGGWHWISKSNARFQIVNINGNVRIVQISGILGTGIATIRMVRESDDMNVWILEEFSPSSNVSEYYMFTICGDVTLTPLDGELDTNEASAFKATVTLPISSIPTGNCITSGNIQEQSVKHADSSDTVNSHTVNSDVPANAKFTDTNTWRPQPDWSATSGDAMIKNKPSLASVATSGSYNDLSNKPTSLPASDVSNWAKADTPDGIFKGGTYTGTIDSYSDSTLHPGKSYYVNTSNLTSSYSLPFTGYGVLSSYVTGSVITQQIFKYNGPSKIVDAIYVRMYINSAWTSWSKTTLEKV